VVCHLRYDTLKIKTHIFLLIQNYQNEYNKSPYIKECGWKGIRQTLSFPSLMSKQNTKYIKLGITSLFLLHEKQKENTHLFLFSNHIRERYKCLSS